MSQIELDYEIQRGDETLTLTVTALFYHGELEDYSLAPSIALTQDEDDDLCLLLAQAYSERSI